MGPSKRKAVFVVGPSSCGKTTTCEALAKHYRTPASLHIKEVARTVMKTQGFSRKDVGTLEMQKAIMDGQLDAERTAREYTVGEDVDALRIGDMEWPILFISDRSALDPVVYAGIEGTEAAIAMEEELLVSRELQQAIEFYRRRSLFVLLPFVKEWVFDDGVRSLDAPDRYTRRMQMFIERFKIPCVEISASIRNLRARVEIVDQYLQSQIDE